MHCRELTAGDYISYMNIFNSINIETNLYYPGVNTQNLQNYYFDDGEPLHKAFGSFDDSNVLSSVVFTRFSDYDRSWNVRYIAKNIFATIIDVTKAIEFAMSFAEQANYYRFYVMYFNNQNSVWERIMLRSEKFNNYDVKTEEVIPPGKRSSFTKYWTIFQGGICYNKTTVIREYSLKNQYRVFNWNLINQ